MKKFTDLKALTFGVWAWGLETKFGPLGPRRYIQPEVQNPSSNIRKQDLIFTRIMR